MVMDVVLIAVLCLTATVLCKIMDKYNKEYALMISLAACFIILASVVVYISPVLDTVQNLFTNAGISSDQIKILVKALGICYITQLACDFCKDNDYTAMATQIEMAGKVSLIIIALPLFNTLISVVNELISL